MRGRGFLLFGSGMVAGAVSLYALLWSGGVLAPYLEGVRSASRVQPRPADPEVTAVGESDRAMVPHAAERKRQQTGGVVAPIENLRLEDLHDTFDEGRSGGRPHEAIDLMAPRGTPVRAMVDGHIEKLFISKLGGLTIYQFDQKGELCYYYAHLDRYADGIAEKKEVARGTVIGYVGSTGNADPSAPHLHLAIFRLGPEKRWWEGTATNPYPVLSEALR